MSKNNYYIRYFVNNSDEQTKALGLRKLSEAIVCADEYITNIHKITFHEYLENEGFDETCINNYLQHIHSKPDEEVVVCYFIYNEKIYYGRIIDYDR